MINFDYYLNSFDGSLIKDELVFNRLAKKAILYIDSIISVDYSENEIAEAVCAVCDVLSERESSYGIKSEKVDEVSVTYENNHIKKILYDTIKLYLPSHLLYRGI